MANWTFNYLKMKNIAKEDLFYTDEDGNRLFDFNKLIPMPEDLAVQVGSDSWNATIVVAYEKYGDLDSMPELIRFYVKKAMRGRNFYTEYANIVSRYASADASEDRAVDCYDPNWRPGSVRELRLLGNIVLANIEKYGAPDWYEWCCKNWGTKWNANGTKIISNDELRFDTAWTIPGPVYLALSKRYPRREVYFEAEYEDPAGELVKGCLKNGKKIS